MSKTHSPDGQSDDLDALLDEYQKTHQVKSVIPKNSQFGISFDDVPEKKKSMLHRLLAKLRQLLPVHLAA